MKIIVQLVLVILLVSNVASASVFDFFKEKLTIMQTKEDNKQEQFYSNLLSLNTPIVVSNLNKEMDDYGVKVLKVRVYELPWQNSKYTGENFYVVRELGVVRDYPTNDKEVKLTYGQVNMMIPFFTDGKIDFLERFQTYAIYKMI